MGFAKIKGQLSSRIGCEVNFSAPKDVHAKGGVAVKGTIVDEVWVNESINNDAVHSAPCSRGSHCWGDYSFCGQLIKWGDGQHTIRLAYYRRRCGEDFWEYASQMTVNDSWQTMKSLMEKTLAKDTWFQENPTPEK